ncbi:uncharacterized protein fam83ga isoform X1 [Channa argus]|uniref:uncharacterized protein fam83ga isoform X1 n=1 Tax=Channa argus TaxID=215402 RepID=UPI00351FCF43
MALSQIQCLDENHVNPRTHESKPEFLYCEDQRLALEALLRDGREAFTKHLEARGLRGFLSDLELETFLEAVEPYDPDSDLFPVNAEDDEPPLSLHYWPDLSDTSVPQLDLGWPDSESYRGVTRATVYTQPPLDGQAHIKEVVRKMIAQAQKVIAVVMDVFTDVDIFRDLLDAGFKRRVAVYILLERTTLPHFMSMCQRANMHAGHLKHLRVRCMDGAEFYTRSCTKVKGRMGHRFMFVDGDKAVSGSYNFTWMSSRLDRNLITVVTGQAVDAFDRLFRHLYVTSSSVDLRQIATEPEPEPEPLPQPAAVVPPSAALARKLYNPKYALLTIGNPSQTSTPSADPSSSKEPLNLENSKNPDVPETDKRRKKRASKEAIEVPPLHPGLIDLEKACLISYLPTWPEPDPPSDVIGFINIRDSSKPTQVHMQRSEMFETSQAIRFSSPLSMPKETLPEVAKPRQFTAKCDEVKKLQPMGDKTKAGESLVDSVQPTQLTPQPDDIKCKKEGHEQEPSSGQKSKPTKDTTEAHRITTKNKLLSSTPLVQDAGSNTTPHLIAHTAAQSSSSKVSTPNSHGSSDSTQTVTTNSSKSESLPELNTQNKAETTLNTQRLVAHETQTLESTSTQSPHLHAPAESNSEQCTQEPTGLPPTNSHTQQQSSSEMTSVIHSNISTASASETNSHSTSVTTNVCTPLSSTLASPVLPPLASPSGMLDLTPPSSTTSPPPPIPKPRTIHLVIKGTNEDLPEFSVDRTERLASMGQLVVHSKPEVATVAQTPPEKEPETVLELHTSKMGKQRDTENTGSPEEAPQQERTVASKETKGKGAVALDDTAAETQAQSAVLIPDAPKAGGVHIQEMIPKEINPSTNGKITSKTQTDQTATVVTDTKTLEKALTNCELAQTASETSNNVTQQTHQARGHETQKPSHCETNPPSNGALDNVKCLNASTHSPFSTTANSHSSTDSADDGTSGQISNPSATPPPHMDSKAHMSKDNAHIHAAYQESQLAFKPRGSSHTPERPLRLHLSDTHIRDLRSQTSERELCSLTGLIRAPSSELLPPDSRTHTPDPRSYTPDLQSPTPDGGDGHVSPRDNSTVSTTSEEYYECCESPFRDPIFDSAGYRKNGTPEDHVTFTHTNTPNAATITTSFVSAADVNHNTHPDKNSSCSETQTIMRWEEHTASEENEKEKNVAERRTEQGSQEIETRGKKEAKKTEEHLVRGIDLTEVVEKDNESQPQAPKRKRPLNKSANESLVDGGAALGNSTKEGTDTKRLSTCGLKPDRVSADGERPDKEKVVDKAALKHSKMEKRDRAQSTRDTDGQKPLHGRQQQQGGGSSSPTRTPRPPRPISATQPLGTRLCESHQLNQAESKDLHGSFQVLDKTSSPRRPPSRPPPPMVLGASGSAGGQKQAKISHSQNNLPSQQHPAAQSRVRVGQSPSQHPYLKPHSSLLLTQSNIQPRPHPRSQNQSVSIREAHREEEARAPFTITFGRLYSLKGLRDKMSRLPAQSKKSGKRGGTSSPVQGRKSTS